MEMVIFSRLRREIRQINTNQTTLFWKIWKDLWDFCHKVTLIITYLEHLKIILINMSRWLRRVTQKGWRQWVLMSHRTDGAASGESCLHELSRVVTSEDHRSNKGNNRKNILEDVSLRLWCCEGATFLVNEFPDKMFPLHHLLSFWEFTS